MENKYKKCRVEYIDVLRGFAIILMVLGHIGGQPYIDKYIHMFHMPIWFFISGYFFSDKGGSLSTIVWKKVRTLLFPYLIWGIVQYPFWIALVKAENESTYVALRNLLWVNTNKTMPIAGALWFLTCLFWGELAYLLLKRAVKNKYIFSVVIIIISVFGNLFTTIFTFRLPWATDTAFVAIGIIYLGNVFRELSERRFVKYSLNLPRNICIIMFLTNGILCFLNGYINMRTGMYGFIPLFWINMLSAIIIYWNFSKYVCAAKNKYLYTIRRVITRIGKNSIVYLCFNQLVIFLLNTGFRYLGFNNINWFLRNIIMLPLTIVILYCIDCFAMNKKTKLLFGR